MLIYIRAFAVLNLVNGIVMLIWPERWYNLMPGVIGTGPYNQHFVRDIGFAFVAAGIGVWFGVTNTALRQWSGPMVGMTFLGGHAIFHVVEMFVHHFDSRAVVRDMILIVVPALIAVVWLVGELRQFRSRNGDIVSQPPETNR